MGKFDRYGGAQGRLGASPGALVPSDTGAVGRILAKAKATPAADASAEAARIMGRQASKVAIALDATGSMASLIAAAKKSVAEIITRASAEAGRPIEIELFAYRDYDVPQQLLERSGAHREPQRLVTWLGGVHATGGGGNDGEAIEVALGAVLDADDFAAVLLIGDEPSNSRQTLVRAGKAQAPTAHDVARRLGAKRVPVHCFVVDQMARTVVDFAEIARLSGGKSGRLDGSREMIDLAVLAIISSLKGAAAVRSYMEGRQLTGNAQSFGQLLLGGR